MLLRVQRRERLPRFLEVFVAAEAAVGIAFYAFWSPRSLPVVLACYAGVGLGMAVWSSRYRRRLRREREAAEALRRQIVERA